MADIDLEQLAALVAAMTPSQWFAERYDDDAGRINWQLEAPIAGTIIGSVEEVYDKRARHDAAGIVALVNAAPALLQLARVGQAYLDYASCDGSQIRVAGSRLDAAVTAYRAATEKTP